MKKINLTQNKYALVNDDDFEKVSQFNWHYSGGYAKRTIKNNGKTFKVLLHRFIMSPPKGKIIDHINMNGLDNRKENLRICSMSENMMNRNKQINNKSGFKGVSWHKGNKRWRATIDSKFIGQFVDIKDAVEAYDTRARQVFGEFARTNLNYNG